MMITGPHLEHDDTRGDGHQDHHADHQGNVILDNHFDHFAISKLL